MNAGEVELLDITELQEQLLTLIIRGGKIDHQTGDHDDYANAAAGAIFLVTRPQQTALCAMPIIVTAPRGDAHFSDDGGVAANWAAYLASLGEGYY